MEHRVNILVFGLTRSLIHTMKSIEINIIEPLNDARMTWHIYLHTYNLAKITNSRSQEQEVPLLWERDIDRIKYPNKTVKIDSQEEFLQTINITDYTTHGDPWPDQDEIPYQSLRNLLCQLNSLRCVTQMACEDTNAGNVFLFIRPDLMYIDPIDTTLIEHCEKAHNKKHNMVFTPHWGKWGGLNDRIACANTEAAKLYGFRIDEALAFSRRCPLHSEKYLAYILRKCVCREMKIRACRVRANGNISGLDCQTHRITRETIQTFLD